MFIVMTASAVEPGIDDDPAPHRTSGGFELAGSITQTELGLDASLDSTPKATGRVLVGPSGINRV
jgi:hypothetical protein